jgi:hypothetical protein
MGLRARILLSPNRCLATYGGIHTRTQQDDLISRILYFKIRESGLRNWYITEQVGLAVKLYTSVLQVLALNLCRVTGISYWVFIVFLSSSRLVPGSNPDYAMVDSF